MDLRFLLLVFAIIYFASLTMAAPRPPPIAGASENEIEENVVEGVKDDKKVDGEIDELGLEYGRYLQEVVKALDEDPEFSKKLENITHDQIMTGHVAKHIETVAPDVRNRLDELKRIELDRLRKLAMKEHQLEEEMARDGNEQHENSNGRQWRSVRGSATNKHQPVLDDKTAAHVDHQNPHTFEAEDLQKLIMQATKDLEELDRKRRRDFKQYEMEKEIHYQDSLHNMTAEQKTEAEKKHNEEKAKHNQHPHVNNPGSKHQFEEVWEQQDHMAKQQDFDPKIFFQMHDVNGDGFLDQEEVEALLSIEVRKLYNEKDPSYDKNEMYEEYHRMREHIYKEIDANRDQLISRKEFLDYTKSPEFEKDEGWKGIEEAPVYTNEELKHYEQQRQALQDHYEKYGAYQMPYQQGMDPMGMGYGQPPPYYYPNDPNYHPSQGYHPDPNYHPSQQPYMVDQHGQPVQYVHMPPEHIQAPVQQQHVQLPPQHYVNGVPQQQLHPAQYQQQLPPGQHPQQYQQQQQYMPPNPNIAQLPPASPPPQQQQQHPNQAQYQQPPPAYQQHPNQPIQGQPIQGQAPPVQYQQGPPQPMHPNQAQFPNQPNQQQQQYAAVPPAQVNQQHPPQAVPNSPPQQQQQPNPGQHH